jgi:predicted Rossmann fold nucleotide-binding protein DprA/Smf involved in DNA uptake
MAMTSISKAAHEVEQTWEAYVAARERFAALLGSLPAIEMGGGTPVRSAPKKTKPRGTVVGKIRITSTPAAKRDPTLDAPTVRLTAPHGATAGKRAVKDEEIRVAVVNALRGGPLQLGEIVDASGFSQPPVSKRLAALIAEGRVEKDGRAYRLAGERPAIATPSKTPVAPRIVEAAVRQSPAIADQVLKALEDGPAFFGQILEKTGASKAELFSCLAKLRGAGRVREDDGKWRIAA